MKDEKHNKTLITAILCFILGCLFGAALSLLFAPRSGRRTRKKIRRTSNDAQKRLAEATEKMKETLDDLVDGTVEAINEILEDHHVIPGR